MLPGGCGRLLGQLGSGHLLSIAAARLALHKHRADSSGGLTLPKGTPRARPPPATVEPSCLPACVEVLIDMKEAQTARTSGADRSQKRRIPLASC